MTHQKNVNLASAILEKYQDEANSLDIDDVIAGLKELAYHPSEVGNDNYAVVTVDLTAKGLRNLYALVKLESNIIEYRGGAE